MGTAQRPTPNVQPDDAKERAWKIHIELQSITLPAKDALALLPELSDERPLPAAWEKLPSLSCGGTTGGPSRRRPGMRSSVDGKRVGESESPLCRGDFV